MKFTPTKEQSHIVATASTGVDVIIQAYAGASKTSTLVLVAEELKDKRILYLAFNKSIATEAQEKMPYNVDCRTVHSVAYQHTDKTILKKLRYNNRPNNKQLAQELGVVSCEALDTKPVLGWLVCLSNQILSWICPPVISTLDACDGVSAAAKTDKIINK